jgi:Family of unknown function (DUF5330)
MFFLLRMAFWMSVVLVLLPSGGSQHTATAPSSEPGAMVTLSAASATVSDMSRFCTRQPEACAVGSQAATAFGQRAQAGAKMVYDFISERAAPRETGSITTGPTRQAAAPAATAAKSHDTLTPADLVPAWRGPRRESHNKNGA